jgi:hypothetical protein
MLQNLSAWAEEILRNQDVQKMVSAGLSDEIIIAKIREAPQVDFQLSIDDLVSLRKAGVSDRVVAVMLERSKPAPQNRHSIETMSASVEASVSLKTSQGTLPLRLSTGEVSSAGFGWTSNTFMNYPGLHATVRTRDKRPVLLVTCPTAPEVGRYFFVTLDPDKRNEVRSLKIGQALRRMASPGGRLAPDKDWTFPFEVEEEGTGTWLITLKSDLKPGEYGWYVNLPDVNNPLAALNDTCFQGGGAFGFGVD